MGVVIWIAILLLWLCLFWVCFVCGELCCVVLVLFVCWFCLVFGVFCYCVKLSLLLFDMLVVWFGRFCFGCLFNSIVVLLLFGCVDLGWRWLLFSNIWGLLRCDLLFVVRLLSWILVNWLVSCVFACLFLCCLVVLMVECVFWLVWLARLLVWDCVNSVASIYAPKLLLFGLFMIDVCGV